MFKTLEDLKEHYRKLRNHPSVAIYEDPDGLIGTWNPKTRQWDWYRWYETMQAYMQTGSTEKRGSRLFKL